MEIFIIFSAEFCSESSLWRLHAAHVLFMRGDKYKEAAAFYEPIVRQNYGDILSVSAAVLGTFFSSFDFRWKFSSNKICRFYGHFDSQTMIY